MHIKIKLCRSELSEVRELHTDKHTDACDWKHYYIAFTGWNTKTAFNVKGQRSRSNVTKI